MLAGLVFAALRQLTTQNRTDRLRPVADVRVEKLGGLRLGGLERTPRSLPGSRRSFQHWMRQKTRVRQADEE